MFNLRLKYGFWILINNFTGRGDASRNLRDLLERNDVFNYLAKN